MTFPQNKMLLTLTVLALPLFCNAASIWLQGDRETVLKNLKTIGTTVEEINGHIKQQDRFQEIKDLLQIDSTLKKLQEQTEELKNGMTLNQGALGRAGGQIGGNQGLERRLDELQDTVLSDVRGTVQKMSEVQDHATENKRDLDKKLGKMMNIMTSLYEAREKGSSDNAREDDGNAASFLTEYMDVMEQRIKEDLSVVSAKLHNEMKAVERVVSSVLDETQGIVSKMESMRNDQNVQIIVESALLNLTRKEREIEKRLENRVQMLEEVLLKKDGEEVTEIISTTTEKPSSTCTGKLPAHLPEARSCWELHRAGAECDGTYIIYAQGKYPMYVYCDMTGGGWTLLMRRGDYTNNTDFHRDWENYKKGFGDLNQEFWLGNENIHLLTTQEEMVLHVHLEDFSGDIFDSEYEPFSVASEAENYRLHVGAVRGVPNHLGSSLRYHNGKPFSTKDRNNDTPKDDCPGRYRGGWWYNRCHYVLLTAPYYREADNRQKWQGIQWHSWKGTGVLKTVVMKVRPKHHQRKNSRYRALV